MKDSTLCVTINTAQQETQDTFKAGSLVISDYKNSEYGAWVVLVSHDKTIESYKDEYFTGTVISSSINPKRIGGHCTSWAKFEFVKFVGNVILEQE